MLGLLGIIGALFASLSFGPSDDRTDEDVQPDGDDSPIQEAWAVSSTFMDPDLDEGLPKSDDVADPVDPDRALQGTAGGERLIAGSGSDTLSGDLGDDTLQGNDGDDALFAGAGHDEGHGGTGADGLAGGDGDDSLWGDDGSDSIWGDDGRDSLAGCEGDDAVAGGRGNDVVAGGGGADTLDGDDGDDTLGGDAGDDRLSGGLGADEIDGEDGDDSLFGGNDAVVDYLNGGEGDDALTLAAGDFGNGGEGADAFTLQEFAPGSAIAQIMDFDPAQDDLVIVYDAAIHPDASLFLQATEKGSILLLDGVALASLTHSAPISLADITLRAA
jgi:Ca2+-binding RTX toxin-like protein